MFLYGLECIFHDNSKLTTKKFSKRQTRVLIQKIKITSNGKLTNEVNSLYNKNFPPNYK